MPEGVDSVYGWRATYEDGTQLTESKTVNYHNIDRLRLRVFELLHKESGEVRLRINFNIGQRLIWRRRISMMSTGRTETVHVVGKQQTLDGVNKQGIALLFERDGSIEFFDRFDPTHPFLREVELLPFE